MGRTARLLICDDEAGMRQMLQVLFKRAGYQTTLAQHSEEAISAIDSQPPFDIIVTDLSMPGGTGMRVLDAAKAKDPTTQTILITAYASTEQAVEGMRNGAYDYIQKPFRNDALLATVEKAFEKRLMADENRQLRQVVAERALPAGLIAHSEAMKRIVRVVQRVADAPSSVLITGESGVGKQVIARAIHDGGSHRSGPFISVNCGAIPENLIESELFGHEKGAFTGAITSTLGLFRAAHGGTLLLDEIGELPKALQAKLLRVLQEKTVRPVGSAHEIGIDVRVLAATNRDLMQEVIAGNFREDLYYRLAVIVIHVPPLRERNEDIIALAEHFTSKHGHTQQKQLSLTADAKRALLQMPFKGNVRELENTIERAIALCSGEQIHATDLELEGAEQTIHGANLQLSSLIEEEGFDLDHYLAEVERQAMEVALRKSQGNQTKAAEILGIPFRSFRYRLGKQQDS